jgi:hypothetical protein
MAKKKRSTFKRGSVGRAIKPNMGATFTTPNPGKNAGEIYGARSEFHKVVTKVVINGR